MKSTSKFVDLGADSLDTVTMMTTALWTCACMPKVDCSDHQTECHYLSQSRVGKQIWASTLDYSHGHASLKRQRSRYANTCLTFSADTPVDEVLRYDVAISLRTQVLVATKYDTAGPSKGGATLFAPGIYIDLTALVKKSMRLMQYLLLRSSF